jgi:hypothetical protein
MSIAAIPMIADMLKMFEPNAFPNDSPAPPDKAAVRATVSSGKVVDKEINVNPTEVFPSFVTEETRSALLIVVLLAQFKTTRDTAMTTMLTINSLVAISAMNVFLPFGFDVWLFHQICIGISI